MTYFCLKTWIQQKWMRSIGKWNTSRGRLNLWFLKYCIVNDPSLKLILSSSVCFLQVLPRLRETNSPEGSSELVQLHLQKGSFQCSSITRDECRKNEMTPHPQTLSVEPDLAWGLLSFPVLSLSSLSQGTLFKIILHSEDWRITCGFTSQGSLSRPTLPPFFLLSLHCSLKWDAKMEKSLLNPLQQCSYVCSM